jgi:hypothetical protein
MPALDSAYSAASAVTVVLAAVLAILLGVMAWRAWKRRGITPEERERRRRAWLVASGKLGDGSLVEIRDNHVFYSYAVRGVEYTASQDITILAEKVPSDLSNMPSVGVKYDPKNPANSIVVAEDWTGLHGSRVLR